MIIERVFVDTSAFYALFDRSHDHHLAASSLWPSLLKENIILLTSNYVISETTTLLQEQIGFGAARDWHQNILSVFDILWVDKTINQLAIDLWFSLGQLWISFVDCTSIVTIKQDQIDSVFCFKDHFRDQGFNVIPNKHH